MVFVFVNFFWEKKENVSRKISWKWCQLHFFALVCLFFLIKNRLNVQHKCLGTDYRLCWLISLPLAFTNIENNSFFLPLIIIKLFVMFWCRHRVVIPKRMPMIIKSWTSGVADAAVIIVIIFHVNLRYRSKILGIHPQTIAGVVHSVWSYFQIVEKCQGCRVL